MAEQTELKNAETTAPPIFADSARWLVAVLLVMGPVLQAIEFLLESGQNDNALRKPAHKASQNPSK